MDYTVQSSYRLSLPPNLIVHASTIEIKETIGQGFVVHYILAQLILSLLSEKIIRSVLGEFGIVYKGHITANQGKVVNETVAIKTLKGILH